MTKRVAGCRSPGGFRLSLTSFPVVIDEPHLHEAGRRTLRRRSLPHREPRAVNTISGGDSAAWAARRLESWPQSGHLGPRHASQMQRLRPTEWGPQKGLEREKPDVTLLVAERTKPRREASGPVSFFCFSSCSLRNGPSLPPSPPLPLPFHKYWGVSHVSGAPVVYPPSPGLQRATRGHLRAEQRSSSHSPAVHTHPVPWGAPDWGRASRTHSGPGPGGVPCRAGLGQGPTASLHHPHGGSGGSRQGLVPPPPRAGTSLSGQLGSARDHTTPPGAPSALALCPGREKKGGPRPSFFSSSSKWLPWVAPHLSGLCSPDWTVGPGRAETGPLPAWPRPSEI